ncbi:MAG: hypothetical protein ABIH21_03840 [Patescibacteria group bacterium]
MKKTALLFATTAIAFVIFVPITKASDTPACVCYHDSGLCSIEAAELFDITSIDECNTHCQTIYGTKYQSSVFVQNSLSGAGEEVLEKCSEDNWRTIGTLKTGDPEGSRKFEAYAKPELIVDIPTVQFAPITSSGGTLRINYIANYLTGIYQYLLIIAVSIAIVLIMVSGMQYILASGSANVSEAKKRLSNAVIGLVLLLSVILILYTVNPKLTIMSSVNLVSIDAVNVVENEEEYVVGTMAKHFVKVSAPNIIGKAANVVAENQSEKILNVAKILAEQECGMLITSTYRSFAKQVSLIEQYCQNPPGSKTCNPKPGKPVTCMLRGMDPKNCPHTTGMAIDIWGTHKINGNWTQSIMQPECIANRNACRKVKCQEALVDAMRSQGFCNLQSEPWHFELPKMSSTCN